jgi:hypothetical protein
MSRKQRQLLFMLATFALLIGLQSLATGENMCPHGGVQCQQTERWKLMQDQQPKTQKSVSPLGGSTGPTVPPKPTQGNTHK